MIIVLHSIDRLFGFFIETERVFCEVEGKGKVVHMFN
jgi:hypothetical protein